MQVTQPPKLLKLLVSDVPFILHRPRARRRLKLSAFSLSTAGQFGVSGLIHTVCKPALSPSLDERQLHLPWQDFDWPEYDQQGRCVFIVEIYMPECLRPKLHTPNSSALSHRARRPGAQLILQNWNPTRIPLRYPHDSNQIPFWRSQGLYSDIHEKKTYHLHTHWVYRWRGNRGRVRLKRSLWTDH